jgi:tetratricopeptide (TPR) repeat protein
MSTLLHYYLDGFIWKLRESSNQETLDVRDTGYRPLINMPQWLRHAWYWGLLILPLIGLNASQLLRPAPGFEQARQLAKITPHSVKAQVRVAGAWEDRGDMDRAIEHYQHAVDLQPDFAPLQAKLARVLTRQGIVLVKQARRAEAVTYFQRSLQIRPFDVETQRELNSAAEAGP